MDQHTAANERQQYGQGSVSLANVEVSFDGTNNRLELQERYV